MSPKAINIKEWQPRVEMAAASFRQPYQFDDLVSEGFIALFKAAEKFDPTKGASFTTYATLRIKGQMKDYLRDWLGKARARPSSRNRRIRDIKVYSLDMPADSEEGEGQTIADTLGSDGLVERLMVKEDYEELLAAMERHLTPRENNLILLRFRDGMTLQSAGIIVGLSEGSACTACNQAVRKLRSKLGIKPKNNRLSPSQKRKGKKR